MDSVDELLDVLVKTDFVNKMRTCKKEIINKSLINSTDIKELQKNKVIHEYIENANTLDYHILYFNRELNKLVNNKVCR